MINTKPNEMIAYVDGSYNKKTRECGSGVVLFYHGKQENISTNTKGVMDGIEEMHNVGGEIYAATLAMMHAITTRGIEELTIYYDYEGIRAWATGKWKTNKIWTKRYKSYYDTVVSTKVRVSFKKVVAHTGDEYNELADKLAKTAVGIG